MSASRLPINRAIRVPRTTDRPLDTVSLIATHEPPRFNVLTLHPNEYYDVCAANAIFRHAANAIRGNSARVHTVDGGDNAVPWIRANCEIRGICSPRLYDRLRYVWLGAEAVNETRNTG